MAGGGSVGSFTGTVPGMECAGAHGGVIPTVMANGDIEVMNAGVSSSFAGRSSGLIQLIPEGDNSFLERSAALQEGMTAGFPEKIDLPHAVGRENLAEGQTPVTEDSLRLCRTSVVGINLNAGKRNGLIDPLHMEEDNAALLFHQPGINPALLQPGDGFFMGVTSLDDGNGLDARKTDKKSQSRITILEDASSAPEEEKEEAKKETLYLIRDALMGSVEETIDSVVGDSEIHNAYRLLGREVVNGLDLGPDEYVISGDGRVIEMGERQPEGYFILEGGTLDARKLGTETIQADRIKGARGLLLTDKQQTMKYGAGQRAGYDIYGRNAETGEIDFGANIVIGSEGNAPAPQVFFGGSTYATSNLMILNGSLTIEKTATVGLAGRQGMVIVGTRSTEAQLVNNGVIKNDVIIRTLSALRGDGNYDAKVTVEKGAILYVGNSSGFNWVNTLVTGAESSRESAAATTLGFFIDGTTRATFQKKDIGTHSHMSVGTLEWEAGTCVLLEIGAGLINNSTPSFELDLLSYDESSQNLTGELDDEQLDISGMTDLLLPDSVRVYWDDNSLVLSGTLNLAAVARRVAPDSVHVANALWSSTGTVKTFSANAVSQLDSGRTGANNFWASGMGDFSRVSTEGSVSGFDYNGGGYAIGADHAFSKNLVAGLTLGQSFGTNKANDGGYASFDQRGIMGGLYGRFLSEQGQDSLLIVDAYASYGNVENRGTAALFGADELARDTWNDDVWSLGLKTSWQIRLDKASTLTPFIGLDYVHGAQGDVNMTTSTINRRFRDGSMQNLSLPVGLTYRTTLSLGAEQYLIPEVTVAYVADVVRDNPSVKSDIPGARIKTYGSAPGRNAIHANAGLGWIITPEWSVGLYYNIENRSRMTNQGVSGTVHYTF